MTIELQKLIDTSVKNMGTGIHIAVKESAIELIKRAYKEKIYVRITSGYRSNTEQAKLYGQGRKSYIYKGKQYGDMSKNIVTNAQPSTSNHNYGLAIDYVLVSEDGKSVSWTVDDKWKRVATIGKQLGFAWGGDWKSFKDYPHLEMMGGLSIGDLQNGKKPNLKIKFTTSTEPTKPIKPTEPTKPKEENGGVRMYKPTIGSLKNEFITMLEDAIKDGVLSDKTWIAKAKNGELPLDDAIGLMAKILNHKKQ